MKTRRTIYLAIAISLTLLDILATLIQFRDLRSHFTSDAYDIGSLLGSQIFLYIALIFWFSVHNVNKKIKEKNEETLRNTINKIGDS